ncbi:WD-repeat protein [Plesiocystis pacifica SIR-1]|uniref:WD-repeat protein n=1 Tax=Plesiocystis pacifica SIR-1 TaxID=391625 RepID=A6G2K3_9BACT|nr:protein kinase [Plesiocystis pacifica]EDM79940.1 WD-repeat protein [Plesiocystis pacifica SIR-1]
MSIEDDDTERPRGTLASDSPTPSPLRGKALGLETRQQKAELEAALFGTPETPVHIGHYTIIGTVGAGGMGVVYVAQDQRLGRRVALKLLRSNRVGRRARVRLQREAQAMARLAHPNVVTVHEVGEHEDDELFVAMEFVGGSNLRDWLKAEPRTWRAIVDTFLQAGEGLAAAHDAGLVHRDFKPDNVLVGDDGRVRVADFGLAQHTPDIEITHPPEDLEAALSQSQHGVAGTHASSRGAQRGSETSIRAPEPKEPDAVQPRPAPPSQSAELAIVLDTPLTETGTVMGTPAYMAPEQHRGLKADARSDQFSFCVALWEALHDQRPFAGRNLQQLVENVLEGEIDEPRNSAEVPAWLRTILRRGLATNPNHRWPSMRAMLHALSRDPDVLRRRRWRRGALAGVTLSLMAALAMRASAEARQNARSRYWSGFTEELLDLERERGFRQANDDARRAKNATRMGAYRRYRPKEGVLDREDSTVAAALLREVEGSERETAEWVSAANEILGRSLSYAIFSGHRNVLADLAFAPDASAVYSASHDGSVWRWDLTTGVGEPILRHEREVYAVAVSPDGCCVASASADRTARLWTRATRRERVIAEHSDELTALRFDPTGRWLASASKDGVVALTEVATGERRELEGHRGPVLAIDFDSTGARVVSAGTDHSTRLWHVEDGRELARSTHHGADVYHLHFVDDGRIVTGSDDGSVHLWKPDARAAPEDGVTGEDLAQRQLESTGTTRLVTQYAAPITALDVHGSRVAIAAQYEDVRVLDLDGELPSMSLPQTYAVWALSFELDGQNLVVANFNGEVQRWRSDGRAIPQRFSGHSQAISRMAVGPKGRWLATGSYDATLRVWDLHRPTLQRSLVEHSNVIAALAIDPSKGRLASATQDGKIELWDIDTGRELAELGLEGDSVHAIDFATKRGSLAIGRGSGKITLWAPETRAIRELSGHTTPVWALHFDDAGERLASTSIDHTLRLWNATTGELEHTLDLDELDATTIDFEPGGARLVSGMSDGSVHIYDAETGALRAQLDGHRGKVLTLVRAPDGRTLATGADDGTVRLWPSEDPRDTLELAGHRQAVWSIDFDARGERMVTASLDGEARVWAVADGAFLYTLRGHAEGLWAARFLPDGRAITASQDNTIRIWPSPEPGRPNPEAALVLSGHSNAVTKLVITRDGRWLLSGSMDGSVKRWDLDQLDTEPALLQARLEAASLWCLDVERRARELGEDPSQAQLRWAECEAERGR